MWDSPMVSGVAFRPRRCPPRSNLSSSGAGWIDSTVPVSQGVELAYRLYISTPLSRFSPAEDGEKACVLLYFHANAELCTDIAVDAAEFYDAGVHAILAPEFRGFAWGTGTPALKHVCPDAEAVYEALPGILQDAGLQDMKAIGAMVVHGRSLGAACAVHLAQLEKNCFNALIVESGCLSLLDLPMVQQMGMMMPEMLQALRRQPEPLGTMAKLRDVSIMTLFLHGDRDEVVPVRQAVSGKEVCGSSAKRLVRYARCGHNDLRYSVGLSFYRELRLTVDFAMGRLTMEEIEAQRESADNNAVLRFLVGMVRCIPGVRRCIQDQDDRPLMQ